MVKIFKFFGKDRKENKKFSIARKVIRRIKDKLETIKALYESTQLKKEKLRRL